MNDFWSNISRYPRFFVSSLIGLIVTILSPFKNLLKSRKFKIIVPMLFIFLLVSLYNIIRAMSGL